MPILSWLILRGKCRFCNTAISIQYPIVELTHAIAWGIISTNHNFPDALIWCTFTSIIINLAIIDGKYFLLPNILVYPLALTGLIVSTTQIQLVNFYQSISGGILGFLILYVVGKYYEKKKGRVVLGGGDAKYVGALGTWFGAISIPYLLIIASSIAITAAIIELIIKRQKIDNFQNKMIPLGVYLSVGALILYSYNYAAIYHKIF
jgi:prepilin signal peptidase PulO-like enzyme (type II secretory pathway)